MTLPDSRFRWILLLSVTLNVLLAAVLASASWHDGHGRGRGGGGGVWLPRAEMLEQVLPASDHDALHAAYERHRGQVRPRMRELWQARREVREALNAEPFDPARANAALAALRARDAEVATAVHALLVDVSQSVSPEGRKAIAKLSTSRRGHGHRHRGRDRDASGGEREDTTPPRPSPAEQGKEN